MLKGVVFIQAGHGLGIPAHRSWFSIALGEKGNLETFSHASFPNTAILEFII